MSAATKKAMGVELSKVDRNTLDEGLDKLELSKGGTNEEKVRRIAGHFKTVAKKDLLECSECGGDSTSDFDVCPYCGAEDEEPKSAPKPKASSRGTSKPVKAEVITGPASKYTVKDLDDSVAAIRTLMVSTAKTMWELGRAIRSNHDKKLWELRLDDEGNLVHRNFKQFCRDEFGLSHTHAYNLMDISATFTKEDVEKVGVTKLGLVLKAPEKHRSKLLERAKKGASKADMEQAVRRIKDRQSQGPPGKEHAERVTIAIAQKRKTMPLFKRPTKKDELPVPAKRIADQPWAEWQLANDVKLMVRLTTNTKGDWVLISEFRRLAADE